MRRVALVTGASAGIGRALVPLLAPSMDLLLVGRRADRLEEAAAQARAAGAAAETVVADLAEQADVERVCARALAHGVLDVLVNNAGVAVPDALEADDAVAEASADELLAVNLYAALALTRGVLPLLQNSPLADVVNVSSLAGLRPIPSQAVYSATKAGLIAFSDGLREELQGTSVRVSSIVPGSARSEILRRFPPSYRAEHRVDEEPRMQAEDVARAVAYALDQPAGVCVHDVVLAPRRR